MRRAGVPPPALLLAALSCLFGRSTHAGRADRNESTAKWSVVFDNGSQQHPEHVSLQLSHASHEPVVAYTTTAKMGWVDVTVILPGGRKVLPDCRCTSSSKKVTQISLQLTANDEPVVAFQDHIGEAWVPNHANRTPPVARALPCG